jgi:transcription elongation factor Elf1
MEKKLLLDYKEVQILLRSRKYLQCRLLTKQNHQLKARFNCLRCNEVFAYFLDLTNSCFFLQIAACFKIAFANGDS